MPSNEIHIDTLFSILEFLSIRDGISLLCVCKNWYELDRFELVWKTLLSNFIQTKIDFYDKLIHHSDDEDEEIKKLLKNNRNDEKEKKIDKKTEQLYRSIISHLKKFYHSQIIKEKSVNKSSFLKYMDDDRFGEEGEKSTVFGMRFKKLASSALNMHYSMIMSKGLEEIKDNFTLKVIDYEHSGRIAKYFLNQAKIFTLNGRVNNSLRAQEYWKRFTFSISDLISSEIGKHLTNCSPYISFIQQFKPIFNDKILEKILNSYWNVTLENENGKEEFLEYILNYISIEGNYEKSSDPYIEIKELARTNNLMRLRYLKQMFNTIYPNQWITNLYKCIAFRFHLNFPARNPEVQQHHISQHVMEFFYPDVCPTPTQVVDNVCEFLDIFEERAIFFERVKPHNIFLYGFEREIIDILFERGLILPNEEKIIFHRFNYDSKISHLLPKVQNFDPYEFISTRFFGKQNFIALYFTSFSKGSPYKFFTPYFEMFPAPLDLHRLTINNEISPAILKSAVNYRILYLFEHYYGFTDVKESIKMMLDNFVPALDVSCIELIAEKFKTHAEGFQGYSGMTTRYMLDGFKYAMENIPHNGSTFELYCQSIRNNYPTNITDFQSYPEGDERMAYLYNLCLLIIDMMPLYFYEDD